MKKEIEVIPPQRSSLTRSEQTQMVNLPQVNPGGAISSTLIRWQADRHARTYSALSASTRAEANFLEAQGQAVDAYIQRGRAVQRLQELPETLATDRIRRRSERAEELRELFHQQKLAEMRRDTDRTHAEIVLVDAQQALRAQREHGYSTHELAWKKRTVEMLDVELNAAERRAILQQHVAGLEQSNGIGKDDVIDDALYEKRAQLNASGLDTSRIDAVIERRQRRVGQTEP